MEKMKQEKVSFFKKWLVSIRPFAFPASSMPVIFGTLLAVLYEGYPMKWGFFIMALLGMIILHSGANILSDIKDYQKGLDKEPNPTSGGVVRRYISIREAWISSILLLSLGTIMGLILVYYTGTGLLIIGLVGLFIGIFYSLGKGIALKYHALGDFAVFMNFGILGSLGAWYVQTSTFSWLPVVWVIPIAMLVVGILHANNWRDMEHDRKNNIHTVASLLKDRWSLSYYAFMIFGPFVLIAGFVFVPYFFIPGTYYMPFTFLIVMLAIPVAFRLWRKAIKRKTPEKPLDFIALDGATSQLNLIFGLLCVSAFFLQWLI